MSKTYDCATAFATLVVLQGRGEKITRDFMAGVLAEAAGVPAARSVACADELMQVFPQFSGLMVVQMAATGQALTIENLLPFIPKLEWLDDDKKNLGVELHEVDDDHEPTGREVAFKTKLD